VERFARDGLVNVLANLVAAAIIYLLGVAVGLFPSRPLLVYSAAPKNSLVLDIRSLDFFGVQRGAREQLRTHPA